MYIFITLIFSMSLFANDWDHQSDCMSSLARLKLPRLYEKSMKTSPVAVKRSHPRPPKSPKGKTMALRRFSEVAHTSANLKRWETMTSSPRGSTRYSKGSQNIYITFYYKKLKESLNSSYTDGNIAYFLTHLDEFGVHKSTDLNLANKKLTSFFKGFLTSLTQERQDLKTLKRKIGLLTDHEAEQYFEACCQFQKHHKEFLPHLFGLETVNLDNNRLTKFHCQPLRYLRVLKLNRNKLKNLNVLCLKNLRSLDVYFNEIKSFKVANLDKLEHLTIDTNPIKYLYLKNLPNFKVLSVKRHKLQDLRIEDVPQLKALYLISTPLAGKRLNSYKILNTYKLLNLKEPL